MSRKSPAKSAGAPIPPLVPQPHGGALLAGGKPGNIGGTGRPKSQVRAALLASFDARIPLLEEIVDNTEAKIEERLKALDMLAKYGLGTKDEVTVSLSDRLAGLSEDELARLSELPGDELLAELGRLHGDE